MGWASGSEVAEEFVRGVKRAKVPHATRVKVYKAFIRALESHDWDTQDEMRGMDKAFDEALGPAEDEGEEG